MAVFIYYINLSTGLQNTCPYSVSYCQTKQWKIYFLMSFEYSKLYDIKKWQSTR